MTTPSVAIVHGSKLHFQEIPSHKQDRRLSLNVDLQQQQKPLSSMPTEFDESLDRNASSDSECVEEIVAEGISQQELTPLSSAQPSPRNQIEKQMSALPQIPSISGQTSTENKTNGLESIADTECFGDEKHKQSNLENEPEYVKPIRQHFQNSRTLFHHFKKKYRNQLNTRLINLKLSEISLEMETIRQNTHQGLQNNLEFLRESHNRKLKSYDLEFQKMNDSILKQYEYSIHASNCEFYSNKLKLREKVSIKIGKRKYECLEDQKDFVDSLIFEEDVYIKRRNGNYYNLISQVLMQLGQRYRRTVFRQLHFCL